MYVYYITRPTDGTLKYLLVFFPSPTGNDELGDQFSQCAAAAVCHRPLRTSHRGLQPYLTVSAAIGYRCLSGQVWEVAGMSHDARYEYTL